MSTHPSQTTYEACEWCGRTHIPGACGGSRIDLLEASLREVYEYMCEVEGALGGHIAVRSYLSLPRTADERKAIGERARRLLEIEET